MIRIIIIITVLVKCAENVREKKKKYYTHTEIIEPSFILKTHNVFFVGRNIKRTSNIQPVQEVQTKCAYQHYEMASCPLQLAYLDVGA